MMSLRPVCDGTTGEPDRETLTQAAEWYVLLASGEASDEDRSNWRAWLDADTGRLLAWRQAEASIARFRAIPAAQGQLAAQALARRPQRSRRRFVGQLAAALAVAGTGWLGYHHTDASADLRTAIGEQRETVLADGSRLQLDTDTAIDVDFSPNARLIRVHRGRILVETAPDKMAAPRPFLVDTAEGRVRALGTRFIVELQPGVTRVVVLDQRVAIQTLGASGAPPILGPGEAARFDRDRLLERVAAESADQHWHRGLLIADNMRLADFAVALARYRRPPLTCAPEAADVRISGAFPLSDSDRALATLTAALPVVLARSPDGDILRTKK